jgi:hypothetical protein
VYHPNACSSLPLDTLIPGDFRERSAAAVACPRTLATVTAPRIPVIEEFDSPVSAIVGRHREAWPFTMLSDRVTSLPDKRGKPSQRDLLVRHHPERGQIEPLRRLKAGLLP